MSSTASWILGAVMGLISLFGLVMAAKAVDSIFYGVGLVFFLFGVGFIFALIGRAGADGET